jgi:hypothetical protein
MKTLSWMILLGALLGLGNDNTLFKTIENLQEELLQGAIVVFPVSINAGVWTSPRKRGIDAKQRLQALILQHFEESKVYVRYLQRIATSWRTQQTIPYSFLAVS